MGSDSGRTNRYNAEAGKDHFGVAGTEESRRFPFNNTEELPLFA